MIKIFNVPPLNHITSILFTNRIGWYFYYILSLKVIYKEIRSTYIKYKILRWNFLTFCYRTLCLKAASAKKALPWWQFFEWLISKCPGLFVIEASSLTFSVWCCSYRWNTQSSNFFTCQTISLKGLKRRYFGGRGKSKRAQFFSENVSQLKHSIINKTLNFEM